ncbi:hypothetical protein YPPY08_3098, partial [Yersinia pestis PY-08]
MKLQRYSLLSLTRNH